MSTILPQSDKDLAEALCRMSAAGAELRAPLRVEWVINYYYLQGVRKFRVLNWKTGAVNVTWESDQGQYKLRFEDVLEQYNRELGLLCQTDVRPETSPLKIMELDGHRKAALSRVYLEHITGNLPLSKLKSQLFEAALIYGTSGLFTWVNKDLGIQYGTAAEIVLPWELVPIPTPITMGSELRGWMRDRWVHYDALRERDPDLKLGKRDNPRNSPDPELDIRWANLGERISGDDDINQSTPSATLPNEGVNTIETTGYARGSDESSTKLPFVRLRESWFMDEHENVHTMAAMVGKKIVRRADWQEASARPPMPGGIIQCYAAGGPFGRPWVSLLVGLNNEVESTISNVFRNAQELDVLPGLLLPANRGIKKEFLSAKNRPRVAFVDPDITGEKYQMEKIEPVNTGDMPGRTAQFGLSLMDRLGRNSELYRGGVPSRIESALGLGMLLETGNISRGPCLATCEDAFATIYKAMLWEGHRNPPPKFRLTTVDDSVAGIVVADDGSVVLDSQRAVPHPNDVKVGIRGRDPRMIAQRKQELMQSLQMGVLSIDEAVWLNHVEGLGLPLGHDDLVRQIEVGMWRNIIAFGDGKTPRGVIVHEFDDHKTQLRVMSRFMRSMVYNLASQEVWDVFEKRMREHQAALGGAYPEEWPHPEEAAMSEQVAQATGGTLPPNIQREVERLQAKAQSMPQA